MTSRSLIPLALAISVAMNFVMVAKVFDAGFNLNHARLRGITLSSAAGVLLQIVRSDWTGRTASDADRLARQLADHGVDVEKDGDNLGLGPVTLLVDHDMVRGITLNQ